jgi:hypothetical protein
MFSGIFGCNAVRLFLAPAGQAGAVWLIYRVVDGSILEAYSQSLAERSGSSIPAAPKISPGRPWSMTMEMALTISSALGSFTCALAFLTLARFWSLFIKRRF